jgi:xylulokinase
VLEVEIQIIDTTGALGAARAAGVAIGTFSSLEEAIQDPVIIDHIIPSKEREASEEAYFEWLGCLDEIMDDETEEISSLN